VLCSEVRGEERFSGRDVEKLTSRGGERDSIISKGGTKLEKWGGEMGGKGKTVNHGGRSNRCSTLEPDGGRGKILKKGKESENLIKEGMEKGGGGLLFFLKNYVGGMGGFFSESRRAQEKGGERLRN